MPAAQHQLGNRRGFAGRFPRARSGRGRTEPFRFAGVGLRAKAATWSAGHREPVAGRSRRQGPSQGPGLTHSLPVPVVPARRDSGHSPTSTTAVQMKKPIGAASIRALAFVPVPQDARHRTWLEQVRFLARTVPPKPARCLFPPANFVADGDFDGTATGMRRSPRIQRRDGLFWR
jgi:hypothetical protein